MPITLPSAERYPMKTSFIKSKSFKIIAAIGSLLFWVGLWQLAAVRIGDSFFLPPPTEVFSSFADYLNQDQVRRAVGASLLRVLEGYVIGVAAGTVLAFLTAKIWLVKALFEPLLSVIRATPVVSIIIVAFLLLQREEVPVWIVILMVLPIVWANVEQGICAVDKQLLEMAQMYGFGFVKKVRKLYLPSVLPYFTSAAITAFGLAWKSGVAAEIICYPENSLGRLIYQARQNLYTSANVFALTLIVVVFSIILEKLLKYLLSKGRRVPVK